MLSRTLAGLICSLAAPAALAAQAAEAGRGALRPYVHVFLAYGLAWVILMLWVWRLARRVGKAEEAAGVQAGPSPE